ncbi:phage integrase SAM-like domain-containing protein [Microcoleus asticus]|uniref:phage integrase SAM-like domain-containing protein n=1 Tax=Microcoleus asticus TaxID=2815231 RepID=UPI0030DA1B8B
MPGHGRVNAFRYTWVYRTQPLIRKLLPYQAQQIELDIATNSFDPSLSKYKPQKYESISVSQLFDQFVEYKRHTISIGGLNKYLALQKQVSRFFRSKTAISVSESVAQKFKEFLAQKLEPVTVRERIVLINACWEWAQKKKLVVENPWADVKVSVPPKQRPEPFTLTEISAIVQKFRALLNQGMKKISLKSRSFVDTGFYDWHI